MNTASANANIARHLEAMAAAQPQGVAIKIPRGRNADGTIDYLALTFAQLDAEVNAWGARFRTAGIQAGDRTLLLVRPGLPLIAGAFALFKMAAVPVIIDPGMGRKTFLACVARTNPVALVGIPSAQIIAFLFPRFFRSVRQRVWVSSSLTFQLRRRKKWQSNRGFTTTPTATDQLAAILFTSGSTGAPKGVCYEHGMFEAQVDAIRHTYEIQPGEIDLPLLPIFALFNPALGMTTIVPEIDPRRPAEVDPRKIVQAIQQERATSSFGSPTLWRIIAAHCHQENITLPTLRRVLCAGAPVPASLWSASAEFLSKGELHSPYGATEALPISSISASQRAARRGPGACVGPAVAGVKIRVIAPMPGAIATLGETQEAAPGVIGEIIVSGPMVTKSYDAAPEATRAAKIYHGAEVWHRLGDCGYFDADRFLWFCGRKVERVETSRGILDTEPCEQIFRVHPAAARCALIGLGEAPEKIPALVVEHEPGSPAAAAKVARELRDLGRAHVVTGGITLFFFRKHFPVDVRHNAKIHRLTLARWAATAQGVSVA